jgi:L-ribulose-5-phosphate 4-epimerase
MDKEGVIKFQLSHQQRALPSELILGIEELSAWHKKLQILGMIGGDDPQRYDGLGFGNLSKRVYIERADIQATKPSFLVTGSQTGQCINLSEQDFAWVNDYSVTTNELQSIGLRKPSSESLTHGVIYNLCASVQYVFHVHSPAIWHGYTQLGLPMTDPNIAYGTQEMAKAIASLIIEEKLNKFGVLAMGGHTDGVIAFGESAQMVGEALCVLDHKAKTEHLLS